MKDFLSVRLVYDRSISPRYGDIGIERLREALLLNAPEWSRNVTVWKPQRNKRQTIDLADSERFAHLICEQTHSFLEFNTGSVDLRGQKHNLGIVVRVHDRNSRQFIHPYTIISIRSAISTAANISS